MLVGWWYRIVSVLGSVFLTISAAAVSLSVVQPSGDGIAVSETTIFLSLVTIGLVVGFSLLPLHEPRPRRVTDLIRSVVGRVAVASLVLVLVGQLVLQTTLTPGVIAVVGLCLGGVLPVFYWAIGYRPKPRRVLVVGDEPSLLESVIDDLPTGPIGFVSPTLHPETEDERASEITMDGIDPESVATTDGSGTGEPIGVTGTETVTHHDGLLTVSGVDRLGGFSRLSTIVRKADVDTLALGFEDTDRGEFFGALQVAHEYGLDVLALESNADSVLVDEQLDVIYGPDDGEEGSGGEVARTGGQTDRSEVGVTRIETDGDDQGADTDGARSETDRSLVAVDVDPWPWYSHVGKRAFDSCFAGLGLLALAPLIVLISIAIKLDSSGPVLYTQQRTAAFGGTFTVSKFRSMVTDAEDGTGATLSSEESGDVDPRVTRVGRILRKTHMDEIPQLGSVLTGDMSVVGPRPERPIFDASITNDGLSWEQRWLLKPGLTGLAQANGVTSVDPETKLALDLEYARRRSLKLDVTLVWLQIRTVLEDVAYLITDRTGDSPSESHSD